jgi:hypothetical protein
MEKSLEAIYHRCDINPHTYCYEWDGALNSDGYPRASIDGDENAKLHRVVFELVHGYLPQTVRHSCDNRKCLSAKHLLAGTPTDNMRDRDSRERHGMAKLSHDEVREIRALWKTGDYLQKDIGGAFGINARTVSSIINRTHWKHVTDVKES